MRVNHPIFQGPLPVTLSIEDRPNPGYESVEGKHLSLSAKIPMWRVQTEGSLREHGPDYALHGMVSRPFGFKNEPDAEVICGGVNSKSYDAVAIGRHANFMQWGFVASPTHMTAEAKRVFVNAIHYIARYEGASVEARKARGVLTRYSLPRCLDALRAKRPNALGDVYAYFSVSEWKGLMKKPVQEARRFALDHLEAAAPYLYPTGRFALSVDEELRELGVPNDSPELLSRLRRMLAGAKERDLAMKLLARYTNEEHESVEAWRAWLDGESDQFFFSEIAGYRWFRRTAVTTHAWRPADGPLSLSEHLRRLEQGVSEGCAVCRERARAFFARCEVFEEGVSLAEAIELIASLESELSQAHAAANTHAVCSKAYLVILGHGLDARAVFPSSPTVHHRLLLMEASASMGNQACLDDLEALFREFRAASAEEGRLDFFVRAKELHLRPLAKEHPDEVAERRALHGAMLKSLDRLRGARLKAEK